ncbi:hypothetical protein TRICI_001443 [Trichomonascus ciferrii]|uniref:Ubiquitin-related modifier 1 n=1 Tax=Trichomonascus ciferrii TaxID=44093 RepID=A0A642V9M4_9ASCO|nr:hypothetical protein TRICI_001443 [Trichomonascus ciferrii]
MQITVEFSGGLETLFNDQREYKLDIPESSDLQWLLEELRSKYMSDSREELFIENDSVRPGILVLINDTDFELLDREEYIIQPNDHILFSSTLHGG